MLLRVNLATGQVTGSSVYVHDLGSVGRIYCSGRWRLDNRDELLGRLRLPPNASDAELIVQTYLAFGEAHPEQLLGDFAYAVFDTRDRHLWLIRDHMGVMPLYYHRAGDLCIVSPSLDMLLADPDIPQVLDEGVVAEWCVNGNVYNQVDTFFTAIKKVPRATRLRLGVTTRMASVYWSPADVAPLVETREPVLVEQLRELLETAILCRLGTTGGQAAHLSGGLDSTPIAIIAGRACRQQGRDFHTWNWCRPDPGDDSDCHEWADARRVAQAEGFTHHEIEVTPNTLLEELLHHNVACDGTTMFSYERHVVREAQAEGVTRIFSGFGGDEILTTRSRDKHLAMLRSGQFLLVFRRLALEHNLEQREALFRLIWRYARLLKNAWWPAATQQTALLKNQSDRARFRLALLNPDFARFAATFLRNRSGLFLAKTIADLQRDFINVGYHQERMESWALLGGRHGIDYVYPYLDKRVVEFALALPGEWYFRRGQNRYLYRQALARLLPEAIKTKGKPAESHRVRQLTQKCQAALLHRQVLDRIAGSTSRYVEPQSLLSLLGRLERADPHLLRKETTFEIMAAFNGVLGLSLIDKRYRAAA